MSQEWDIDDILASLDELLQEDDKKEGKPQAKKPEQVSSSHSSVANKPTKPDTIPTALEPQHAAAPETHTEKSALKPPQPVDIDVPEADFRQEPEVSEPAVLPRILLTEDMLVEAEGSPPDEAFTPLMEAMCADEGDEQQDEAETEVEAADPEEPFSVHLDEQQVAQVLELVSMDVSYQFNQMLPEMIRKSLKTHVKLIQQEQNKDKDKE